LKKNIRRVSRRRFLTISSFTLGGVWAGYSAPLPARAVRGLIAETGRPVIKSRFIPAPQTWENNALTAAWLGHSTVLVNFYGVTILTDPVLLKRVGADTCVGTVGMKRLVAPALKPAQLPPIDVVLLSHAHMDHLDPATLRELPGTPAVVTARETEDLLRATPLRAPQALAWGDSARITSDRGVVEIEAFEVKHWGARWRFDKYRGYNGYVISREGKRIIFGGDTALSSSFRRLRSRGSFEWTIMPIGAYNPWVVAHCTPEQAVRMANDVGASRLLPIHFKTFALGREGTEEPLERLEAAIEPERIGWREVGQTFRLS
jgi:L-ascorbate metabolism protein UlaG (beta-lactamase superfamily)